MTQCWHPNPEQRPNFSLILERLGYCAQDPQVMNALLPVFNRPPSNERDTTVMRPEHSDQSYLKVSHVTLTYTHITTYILLFYFRSHMHKII